MYQKIRKKYLKRRYLSSCIRCKPVWQIFKIRKVVARGAVIQCCNCGRVKDRYYAEWQLKEMLNKLKEKLKNDKKRKA